MKNTSKITVLFISMAMLLLGSIAGTYLMGLKTLARSRDVQAQHQVIDLLLETMSTLKDAETGQRGFLLTGSEKYLSPYRSAVTRIYAQIEGLRQLGRHGELNAVEVEGIARLADEKLSELERTIKLRQQGDAAGALRIVDSDDGIRIMGSIRAAMGRLVDDEEADLRRTQLSAYHYTIARSIVYVAAAVVNLGFLGWMHGRIRAEIAARQEAAAEVQRQKDLLSVTLASIGDAIIVTDVKGRITFLNAVAERLTGWRAAEAGGRRCAEVFQIINESTRAVVESPVEKVLQLGNVVGLANHTLLIRKDGSELPIDDSGAPIRDVDGTLRGVVLVFRDFTEHKESERKLLAAKEELEAASKAKDQFMAALSHELRTPLTPVLATLTTWEASEELPAGLRADVQMLRRNVELEARLIDDLLDLTRIVKGKMPLNLEVVDVHELIESVAGMYQSEIQAKRLHLSMQLEAGAHNANIDPARFQQVCWNILKNATKFTPEEGDIAIRTENEKEGQVSVTFRDSGIGMSAEAVSRLFRPFEQGSADTVRRFGGLGLGMAISKALVDAHHGTLTAASEGEGKGATFRVTLPTSSAAPALAKATPAASAGEAKERRSLQILLVEDHADTSLVMSRLLERLGHVVEVSESVGSALRTIERQEFDLILSDIGLPDGTGIELIRSIRSRQKTPAIALTGFGMDEDIARCREAGFDAHLTKPINFQKLEMVIGQLSGG